MKAHEFITESDIQITAKLKSAIEQEINKQITSARTSLMPLGFFEIYDIMNQVASANGVDDLPVSRKLHNHDAAAPYTDIEKSMLRAAYTAAGQPWDTSILDLSNAPNQHKSDGAESPMKPFKGYPR